MLNTLYPVAASDTKPAVCVHFVRNGPAYLPEIDAYVGFIHAHGQQALLEAVRGPCQSTWVHNLGSVRTESFQK